MQSQENCVSSKYGSGILTETVKGQKLTQKLELYRSHYVFLQSCLDNNFVPNGLSLKFGYSGLPDDDSRTQVKNIIRKAERDLVDFCKQLYLSKFEVLAQEYSNFKTQLTNHPEHHVILEQTEKCQGKYCKIYTDRKAKKFQCLLKNQRQTVTPPTIGDSCSIQLVDTEPILYSTNTRERNTVKRAACTNPISQQFSDNITEEHTRSKNNCSSKLTSDTIQSRQHNDTTSTNGTQIHGTLLGTRQNKVNNRQTSDVKDKPRPWMPRYRRKNGTPYPCGDIHVLRKTDRQHYTKKKERPRPQTIHKKNRRFRKRTPKLEPLQVINLSATTLTREQEYVLSLGPKFCPTPGPVNELQLSEDVHEGSRRLRLAEFYYKEDTPTQKPSKPKFYKKTGWEPPSGRDNSLDAYCSSVESLTTAFQNTKPAKKNLSRKQISAIKELRQMVEERKIRITPADKGGAVVVQDMDRYKEEAFRQLDNDANYQALTNDPTREIAEVSNTLVDRLKSEQIIDENTYKWATINPDDVKTHTFYHLPKVHKDRNNPPGRPIVSGINGPTEKLSKLVDHFLQPIVQTLPSNIKDTTHFLQVIEEWNDTHAPLHDDVLFVTIDVVGLYANIPHGEVETSIKEAISTNSHLLPPNLSADTLLDIVKHVLANNILQFDGKIYKQTFGTAMGTPMAPTIANIFMGWLEKSLLSISTRNIPLSHWRRFIDDIALLWMDGEEELKQFLEWINTVHPSIKFTANYGTTDIPYLDVNVSVVNGKLTTDLHVKDTDAEMCLPFHSCHPRHCTRSIPYSQCLRLRRICSTDTAYHKRCEELKRKLSRRGYPSHLVDEAIRKVGKKTRADTLRYVSRETHPRVPFVVTHNPQNPPLSRWLKNLLPVMHSSMRMRKAIPRTPIVGERNCPNLRKILMPSALPTPLPTDSTNSTPAGCHLCKKRAKTRGCTLCKLHMKNTEKFKSVITGMEYNIKTATGCTSTNVVYLLDCNRCKKVQYVGETSQTMKKRFDKHRSDVNTAKPTLVARHFCQPDHSLQDIQCTVIETVRGGTETRKRREKFWRWKLRTNYPQGLNVFD